MKSWFFKKKRNQKFLLNDNSNNNRKASSYFVDGALKLGLKWNQEIMTKSRLTWKQENLTSVNSNILALGTEHEQKPSFQQQNLMKNLIKTRNLNKIETGVGLTMSVVARDGVERKGL